MNRSRFLLSLFAGTTLLVLGATAQAQTSSALPANLAGDWALTLANGGAGWLRLASGTDGKATASYLWGGGSVYAATGVDVSGRSVVVRHERPETRRDSDGKVTWQGVAQVQLRVEPANEGIRINFTVTREGLPEERASATGRRQPALPARPDLARVQFGEPVSLLSGPGLKGWKLSREGRRNGWSLEDGILRNRPEGGPGAPWGDLQTEQDFEDFRLQVETRVPPKGNSGVFLRGQYEVQVADSAGQSLGAHGMGAIYSRIAPARSVERPAGEWQTMEITMVDRHVTVVLNGETIIDNQPLEGCTGGALSSDVTAPGPILLQGDHGPIEYRNLVLRPVVRKR